MLYYSCLFYVHAPWYLNLPQDKGNALSEFLGISSSVPRSTPRQFTCMIVISNFNKKVKLTIIHSTHIGGGRGELYMHVHGQQAQTHFKNIAISRILPQSMQVYRIPSKASLFNIMLKCRQDHILI